MADQKKTPKQYSMSESAVAVNGSTMRGLPKAVGNSPAETLDFPEEYENISQRVPSGLPVRISTQGIFSTFLFLINHFFGKPNLERHQAVLSQKLLEYKKNDELAGTENEAALNHYQEKLLEIFNTVNKQNINKIDLAFTKELFTHLDSLIRDLGSNSWNTNPDNYSIYKQLLVSLKLLQISIVLFEDVEGLDKLNRLVQRNQAFLRFKESLQAISQHWIEKEGYYFSHGFSRELLSSNTYTLMSRFAGNPTTPPPPPPPPSPPPPKKNPPPQENPPTKK